MKIEISSFADPGNIAKERIVLRALSNINIGDYAVFTSGIASSGEPTSGRKAAYWFPDSQVYFGDLVILYTKRGKSSTKELKDGSTAHFFYWGKEESLWGRSDVCAVVLSVPEWEFQRPPTKT